MQKKSNLFSFIIFSSALAMGISGPAQAQTSKADVFTFFNADETAAAGDVVGQARLHRSKEGANLGIETTELVPGDAYTIWWIIFNNPDACAPPGCSGADFPANGGDPAVEASVMNATGRVADSDGNATFSAFLPAGFMHTNRESTNPRQAFGPGLQNVRGAEIHVVVRSHGPSSGNIEQISTLFADCNADDGTGGMVCFDAQAAVFPLPRRKHHHDD